jgi:hypothetical protein
MVCKTSDINLNIMIFKAISKTGSLGSSFVYMDIGSSELLGGNAHHPL